MVYREKEDIIFKLYELTKKYRNSESMYLNPNRKDLNILNFSEDSLWHPWGQNGNRMNVPFHPSIEAGRNLEEYNVLKEVYYLYEEVYKDYFSDHKDCGNMPLFTKRLINNKIDLSFTLLEHKSFGEGILYKESSQPDLMQYHVDTANYDLKDPNVQIPEAGARNIATLNTYLNDNYEGGKINFFHVKDEKVKVSYKPKAGDMIIYPSGWPMTHGVQKAYGNERYVLFGTLTLWYDRLTVEEMSDLVQFNQVYFEEESKEVKEIKNIDGRKL